MQSAPEQSPEDRERERRNFVEFAASAGIAPEQIALLLVPPIPVGELKERYAMQLEIGPAKTNLKAATALLAGINKGNMAAIIYWTKAKMGWKENAPQPKEPAQPSEASDQLSTASPTAGLFKSKLKVVR